MLPVLKFRVGPAQLGLLTLQLDRALLQLGGEPLGFAQQGLRPRIRHDRIDGNADGPDELVKECQVHVTEPGQRGQLEHT